MNVIARANARTPWKQWFRWTPSLLGFPIAGYLARIVAGPIDSSSAAVVGGLVAGAVIGAVQALALPGAMGRRVAWAAATTVGTAVGLATGSTAVGFETDTTSLVAMGGITGAFVGVAQAATADMEPVRRAAWAVATPMLWGLGWLVTLQIIVDPERQHAMFGSSGAIPVVIISGLILILRFGGHRDLGGPPTNESIRLAATR